MIDLPPDAHPLAIMLGIGFGAAGMVLVFGLGFWALAGILIPKKWWKRSQK